MPGSRKIFLLGFMGSGKTHWATIWSKKYALPCFDLDHEIELTENKSVAEIFGTKGEKYFRESESRHLKNFKTKESFILSTGGGTPCFNNNVDFINETGLSIYLKCSTGVLFDRLIKEKDKRPLIKELSNQQLKDFIKERLGQREQYYMKANIILEESKAGSFIL